MKKEDHIWGKSRGEGVSTKCIGRNKTKGSKILEQAIDQDHPVWVSNRLPYSLLIGLHWAPVEKL